MSKYDASVSRARLITAVPGGVGPMTIAVLLAQTVQAALASDATEPTPTPVTRPQFAPYHWGRTT
jgi:hypothetical protein